MSRLPTRGGDPAVRGAPDFEKLLQAYREAMEPESGATNVRDAVRSGLKRVEDTAEAIRKEREAEENRGGGAPA